MLWMIGSLYPVILCEGQDPNRDKTRNPSPLSRDVASCPEVLRVLVTQREGPHRGVE